MTNMPTFQDRDWATRKGGDFFYYSENKFMQHWDGQFAHFGLGEHTEHMATWKLSAFISHAPDFLAAFGTETKPFFIEVQGTGMGGADQDGTVTHKFKAKKLDALAKWNSTDEVAFWLWDDSTHTAVLTSYVSIRGMIARGLASQGLFDGKRPYWAIDVQTIIDNNDYARLVDKYG